ncbi:CLIP-domain serine protease subfamily B [Anopheles darlingi]|uniref:CLIP domain-containing serine protease n=1 Tax=Anopheles darlingi TaxID=43151 RepID=W5JDI2_ANODA|nr:CLIP domain-containing serine protease B15-like [Anopheles darlingi]ETN60940.1 CLIP-domain serine protease subfamily B [Anopheles darlingi]
MSNRSVAVITMEKLVRFSVTGLILLQVLGSVRCDTAQGSLNNGDPCVTPIGTEGICQPVRQCPFIMDFRKSSNLTYIENDYLESLKCGEMVKSPKLPPIPLMCCPKHKNEENCGPQFLATRIIGGEEADPGDFPWAALLFYDTGRNRTVPNCGGTLITNNHVITAAHCVVDRPKWTLKFVRFNDFNISSTENCTEYNNKTVCRDDYLVDKIIPHPEYNMKLKSRPNDICLLWLAREVVVTDFLIPICLPLSSELQKLPVVGEEFVVAGWGATENRLMSEVLLYVELPGVDNEACNSVYSVANVTLTDKQLCVGGLKGLDSCRGDSGGPLMRQEGFRSYLVGVVSFGARNCGTENLPGVYTNVVKYLNWIETQIFAGQFV